MKLSSIALGCALAAGLALPASAATLANTGFESGLDGWTYTDGLVSVVPEAYDVTGGDPVFGEHFLPPEGDQFAQLIAGEADVYTVLSQAFTVVGSLRIEFDAAFLAYDYDPYDDDAYVRIYSATTNEVVFASSVLALGDLNHTKWTRFSSGVLSAGDYVLEAGVRNFADPDETYSSRLLIDNVAAVPEPATWGLMILGFAGVGAALRRRSPAVRYG